MMTAGARVVVAMSGGVDSSVAAGLLLEEGCEVVGLFMRSGAGETTGARPRGCCSLSDARDAEAVAACLGIPFYAVDLAERFADLIDLFVDEYAAGRTPNPCIVCNRRLKLGALLDQARGLGASHVATGHYARLEHSADGMPQLSRGLDRSKDQSYVLFDLSRDQLASSIFPVGALTKAEVRQRARDWGLPVSDKPDSQEICFVPTGDYRDLLRARRPQCLVPGEIVHVDGTVLGRHEGSSLFTIGQRRGLGIARGHPLYVVAVDPATGRVTVGEEEDLLSSTMSVARLNWVSIPGPEHSLDLEIQIRHRHHPVPGTLVPEGPGSARVTFHRPVRAVTPGQAAVFYRGDLLLGGGWIAG